MEPGVYLDIPNDEYHSSAGISNTGLGQILQSPYHYWSHNLDPARPTRPQTRPQEDGHIAHCAILEPDEFVNRYVVGPQVSRATKAWKEFCEIHDDKTVIQPDQYARAMRQRDAAWKIPEIAKALSKGNPEVSAVARDPDSGALCRVRPDFVHDVDDSTVILVDVKTYSTADPAEFARQCARMSYHRQAAYYTDIYKIASGKVVAGFIFLSVEMLWPNAASAAVLDEDSMFAGLVQYQRALDLYAQCLEQDRWPGYSDKIQTMRLPHYKLENEE